MLSTDHTPQGPGTVAYPERETDSIRTGQAPVVDAFSLLDHRTREQTIAAVDAPRGRYLAIEDGDAVRLLPLTRPIIHIGRGLVADVRLEDPHVSRRHAIVALRGEGVRVLDDRSANGTFVNGRTVSVAQLSDGDVVRVGRAVLRYIEVDSTPRTGGHATSGARAAQVPDRSRPGSTLNADRLRRTAVG